MNDLENYLPKEVVQCLQEHYYVDLNSESLWNSVLAASDEKSVIENIEKVVNIGRANIVNFVNYNVVFLDEHRISLFKSFDNDQFKWFRSYLILLACLVNIDLTKQGLPKLKLLKCLTKLFHLLDPIQPADVVGLLCLPFMFKKFDEIINHFNDPSRLNESFEEHIDVSELVHDKNHDHFSWITQASEIQKNLVLNVLRLHLLLKKIFFTVTVNKSYGYYQCLLDHSSGQVLYSIQYKDNSFLLLGSSTIVAANTNIKNIQVINNHSLIMTFKQGMFYGEQDNQKAAFNAALQIDEVYKDDLFTDATTELKVMLYPFKLYLEAPPDNPIFTELILEQLTSFDPNYINIVKTIPSLLGLEKSLLEKYLGADPLNVDDTTIKRIIQQMKNAGQKHNFNLNERSFENVKEINLDENEILIQEGAPSRFVYLAMGEGLEGSSEKSRVHFTPKPWTLVGHVAVIQNSLRTATVVAKKKMTVLMIPAATYIKYWHAEFTESEFINEFQNR